MCKKSLVGLAFLVISSMLIIKSNVTPVDATLNNWVFEIVDELAYTGQHSSLALDSEGYGHVAYYKSNTDDLKYAFENSTGWYNITVDDGGPLNDDVGQYASIAVDGNGFAHISYASWTSSTGYDLKYAFQNSSGWFNITIDGEGSNDYLGNYNDIALDTQDYPHISYCDSSNNGLKYAFQNSSGWYTQTVATGGSPGRYTSIAVDSNDYPHISHYNYSSTVSERNLECTFQNSSGWFTETVDSNSRVGEYSSLALDSNGYPHISYYDSTNTALKYAFRNTSGWFYQTVDNTDNVGAYCSLALDGNDYAHISYYDGTNYQLKFARMTENGWVGQIIEKSTFLDDYMFTYTSLALDASGHAHISYSYNIRFSPGYLRYARTKSPLSIHPEFSIIDEFFSTDNITYMYHFVQSHNRLPIRDANVTVTYQSTQYTATDEGDGNYEVVFPYSSAPEVIDVTINKTGIITTTFTYNIYIDPPAVGKPVGEVDGLFVIIFIASLGLVVSPILSYRFLHSKRKN